LSFERSGNGKFIPDPSSLINKHLKNEKASITGGFFADIITTY